VETEYDRILLAKLTPPGFKSEWARDFSRRMSGIDSPEILPLLIWPLVLPPLELPTEPALFIPFIPLIPLIPLRLRLLTVLRPPMLLRLLMLLLLLLRPPMPSPEEVEGVGDPREEPSSR
jgi:hypothetical protein